MLAYTIGQEAAYDASLTNTDDPPHKVGARPEWDPPYDGGWVWRTPGEAAAFILAQGVGLGFTAAVYEIELPLGWDEDVSPEPHEDGAYRLLNDARIVRKVWGTPRSSGRVTAT